MKEEPIKMSFRTRKYSPKEWGGTNTLEIEDLLNIDLSDKGLVKRRKGWRTFDEMIHVLLELNKSYKKYKAVGDFTIRLPLNRSRGKRKISI